MGGAQNKEHKIQSVPNLPSFAKQDRFEALSEVELTR
jgi:hypothetical protein